MHAQNPRFPRLSIQKKWPFSGFGHFFGHFFGPKTVENRRFFHKSRAGRGLKPVFLGFSCWSRNHFFRNPRGGGVPLQTGGLGGQGGSDPHTPGVWGVPLGDPSGLGVRNPPKGGPDRPNRVPKRPKTGRFGCGSRRCLSFGRGRNGNRARTARKDRQ